MEASPSLPGQFDSLGATQPANVTAYASLRLEGDVSVASPRGVESNGLQNQTSPSSTPEPKGHSLWLRLKSVIRPQQDTHLDVAFVVLAAVVYGVLFFSIGTAFLPGHPAWCTLLLWASSIIGASIAYQLFLPRVIGMLVAGILLQNIPWSAIDAFPSEWGTQMRAAALATIFLRCGLELDFDTMRRFKYPAINLALIPGLIEAVYDAGLAVALFGMSYTLGLCMGFILKAVGPGLVVPAMFRLQKAGIGTDQGIPSTVVISASFDDVVAITGYAIFSTIAIQSYNGGDSGSNQAWTIASGPLQVIFGILGGIIAGFAIGATKLWNTHMKRFVALFFAGLLLMFFLEYFKMLSGGALGALFAGLVASNLWEKGMPRRLSLGSSYSFSPDCERTLSVIWRWIMEPILFVTVGSTLDFSTISSGTIPKSLIIVCTGVVLRMICTYFAMWRFRYTWKERVFYAVAWTPKATVQAALSAAPLTLIKQLKVGDPDYDQWVQWGNEILTTGLFAIVICGTLGVIAIHFTAPVLLKSGTKVRETTLEKKKSPARGVMEGSIQRGEPGREADVVTGSAVRPSVSHMPRAVSLGSGGMAHTNRRERAGSVQLQRSSSADFGPPPGRATSPTWPSLITGEDIALVAEFIDSVTTLTHALDAGERLYPQTEIVRISDRVNTLLERIEEETGRREPSVRELFRTVSVRRRTMRLRRVRDASKSDGDLQLNGNREYPGDAV